MTEWAQLGIFSENRRIGNPIFNFEVVICDYFILLRSIGLSYITRAIIMKTIILSKGHVFYIDLAMVGCMEVIKRDSGEMGYGSLESDTGSQL